LKKRIAHREIILRSTSEALEFLRQVRFLPDFDPDRAAVRSVRRKVIENFAQKKIPVEYSQKKGSKMFETEEELPDRTITETT
jgi:hypothetical protein